MGSASVYVTAEPRINYNWLDWREWGAWPCGCGALGPRGVGVGPAKAREEMNLLVN